MIDTAARTRWSLVILIAALTLACANVGQILLTHANYMSWSRIGVAEMDAVHDSWESIVDIVIMPLSIASAASMVAVALLRHPRVPWWAVGAGIGLQVAVFVTSFTMWAEWQNQIGTSGLVRMPDGSLSEPYVRLMDTHWLRIAMMTVFALFLVGMAIAAVTRRSPPAGRDRTYAAAAA
ncbi:hypothetical protein KIPE111705_12720 [Kibdelosporangium persicum]|uniref:DUF1772 domain-containing protein n=1 Tax=Kibdelosporangium persicum TaxID=2698649 RepID=A0ABX2FAW7_9PSEU|nr:hypothetical protein [Kibdelosporangium persicum]NRN68041.1 hypothetical protein [Kibdelosporangium persicum]